MNLHEYQGKSILKSYGVAIQEGIVVDNPSDALKAADELQKDTGTDWFVVKAQIHAGGRGKGTITETGSHGVVIAKGKGEVGGRREGEGGGARARPSYGQDRVSRRISGRSTHSW